MAKRLLPDDPDFAKSPEAPAALPYIYDPQITGTGWMTCKVDECDRMVRSRWGTLCNTHYFRGRRTGTTKESPRAAPALTSHGYLAQNWKGHPAASKCGVLYEHRKVFYEQRGPDGHQCHWCGLALTWGGTGKNKLHVDHRDGRKTNNAPENLLPSCHRCNYKRGMFMAWVVGHPNDMLLRELYEEALGKSNRDTTDWRSVPQNDDNPQEDAA